MTLSPHAYGLKTKLAMDIKKDTEDIDIIIMKCEFPVIYGITFPTKPKCSLFLKSSETCTKTELLVIISLESLLATFSGHKASKCSEI